MLQVTEAVGGMIRLRALVSAHDAGALWDLRCLVRERLVGWVWEHRRDALPRLRADVAADGRATARTPPPRPASRPPDDARVFGGGDDGDARGGAFIGPGRADTGVPPRPSVRRISVRRED